MCENARRITLFILTFAAEQRHIAFHPTHMEKKGKILIIDDNEDILFGLNMLLKPLVDEVRVATRPDQLLRFYQMIQPDVVLMDMNFSYGRTDGREGFDMLHEVLKLHRSE